MSTKIYWAYRIRKSRLNDFIDLMRDQMFKLAVTHIKKLMKFAKVDEEKLKKDIASYCPNNQRKKHRFRRHARFDAVIARCKEEADSGLKGGFDVDCGLNIWVRGAYVYVMPVAQDWFKSKLKVPKWVEDYSYENSTDDLPRGVTRDEYAERGVVWDKVCLGTGRADHNARRLYHSVIELEGYRVTSKYELQTRVFSSRR